MPTVARNLPYFDHPTTVKVRGHSVPVKRDQIVIWVSVAEKGLRAFRLAGLRLSIDCRKCQVTIRTQRRFRLFR